MTVGKNNIWYTCMWCGKRVDEEDVKEGEQFCSDDCSYLDARDGGWVSDAEHEENVSEGWTPDETSCPQGCCALDHLVEVLDEMGVEYSIELL